MRCILFLREGSLNDGLFQHVENESCSIKEDLCHLGDYQFFIKVPAPCSDLSLEMTVQYKQTAHCFELVGSEFNISWCFWAGTCDDKSI
jgi:hypothetical protein